MASSKLHKWLDKVLSGVNGHGIPKETKQQRRWRLLQVESSIACNLTCIMCPWREGAHRHSRQGHLSPDVWKAISPYLKEIQSIDFTGGGEPLLQPLLVPWVREACEAGCETGILTNATLLTGEKSEELIEAGIDWICVSMDGATAEIYEKIRPGAQFKTVCDHVAELTDRRRGPTPKVMINFVMMPNNLHQLEAMVTLADRLGVDQINFKQCDVIRGDRGKGLGLFGTQITKDIRKHEKMLRRARRLAKNKRIETTAFSWVPEELPVCAQDPRNSMFIRHDGSVGPCVNLALGGPTTFLGKDANMPFVHYGRLPEDDLFDLWETSICRFYRERFEQRMTAYETGFRRSDMEPSPTKIRAALENAQKAMPPAPDGCRVCHYLYNI